MFNRFFADNKDLGLVLGLVVILVVLFAPIPSVALDLAIITNFGFALTILLLTVYVKKPVEFSTFPSLLLIATLFRLSLNVAATRLILTEADAGEVINSIGAFAVGGNFVVGLVVFLILIVVQYVVVTSGAQRVSEVAARFMLDSMPGQQMSIDADLNMGLIDQKQAVQRRAALEKEASFYGAMDGASKFVKGDSIAGVIILLINIIAGWIIGVAQMGMSWDEALHRFTLLTIGDGIATQLPALIISIATGIIVTRSSADKELSAEVLRQLSSHPRVLLIVAGILSLFLLLPGMPKWPLVLIVVVAGASWYWLRNRPPLSAGDTADETDGSPPPIAASSAISVAVGKDLGALWRSSEAVIMGRIAGLRELHEAELGIGFPQISLVDGPGLPGFEYEIRLFGSRYSAMQIQPGHILAIRADGEKAQMTGVQTHEPAFGMPAVWLPEADADLARAGGYTLIDPMTMFITHLGEVVRTEAATLLTRATVSRLLDDVRVRQPGLVEELIPSLMSLSDVQRVLQNLIGEGVPIAALDLIVEHIVDLARSEKDPAQLTEHLRQRIGYLICSKLKGRNNDLAVLSLDPRMEHQLQASVAASQRRDSLGVDPQLGEIVVRKLAPLAGEMMRAGRQPTLLCGGDVRRALRALTRRSIPRLAVVSVAEIPQSIELSSFGVVRQDTADKALPTPRLEQASS